MTASANRLEGLRATALVFVAVGVANLANYAFHLTSARSLGPGSYGDVATLAALLSIATLPLAGPQIFVARHVAANASRGEALNRGAYVTGFAGMMIVAGGAITALMLVLVPAIAAALSIGSSLAVALAALTILPSFGAAALLGAAQGTQQFTLVSAALAVPPLSRVVLVVVALAAGLGVAGAMGATLAGAALAIAIPWVVLRRSLVPARAWRPALSRTDAHALLPVVVGMLAITGLTVDDVIAAKVAFPAHEAGLYGAGSLIGRVILYLPFAVVTVLLPRVAARVSLQRGTQELLLRSLLLTGAFCVAMTLLYAALPHAIVTVAVGSKYTNVGSLLWMFGVAMTFYSLLNVLLSYRLGHGETLTCWLLGAGVIVQALLFALFHGSPRELLWATIATGAVLLALAAVGPARDTPGSFREAWARRSAET